MPHPEVRFAPTDEFSRQPTSREARLFNDFSDHQFICNICDLRNRVFCSVGNDLALAVADSVYYAKGKTYATNEFDKAHVPVQVEIPMGCDAVRDLLKTIDRRFRERKRAANPAANTSYDRTYHIPARTVAPPVQQQQQQYQAPAPVIQYSPAPAYVVPAPKKQYQMPLQYPAPLPLPSPPRTRKRYSTATTPAAFTYYNTPEQAPQPDTYRYYR
ncbi:MAG: hypothetical protein M1814_006215 [Vezdaea aestivalis]|nr:MAG: hypothetical protein M1814_006215 [Vezdaea aestivalis]